MYRIQLGNYAASADGLLKIHNDPGCPMPYVTIVKGDEVVFFAPFDTITSITKNE